MPPPDLRALLTLLEQPHLWGERSALWGGGGGGGDENPRTHKSSGPHSAGFKMKSSRANSYYIKSKRTFMTNRKKEEKQKKTGRIRKRKDAGEVGRHHEARSD